MIFFLEKYIFPTLTRLGEARHLRAVRDGLVAVLPLIMTGSFFLLLGQLPGSMPQSEWGQVEKWLNAHLFFHSGFQWYAAHHEIFLIPYFLTMKIMALYAAFTVSASLARSYQISPETSGMLGIAGFLMTTVPQHSGKDWMLPLNPLGGQGLFLAILLGLISAEVYRYFETRPFWKMPEGVPPAVTQAFSSLLPFAFLIFALWILRDLLRIDLESGILKIMTPVEKLGDTLGAVILITLLIHLIWLAGIHGVSVMNALLLSLWLDYLEQNAHAVSMGIPPPYVTAHPFYQWFVWIGGSGATLGLVFLLWLSRAESLKGIGKMALLPSLCNINEPVIFGLPIVLNPVMAIPFLLAPTSCGVTAYLAMKHHLVRSPYLWVPWTLPAPLGAFLSTGSDWRAVVLFFLNLMTSTLIYYPFFKHLERKALKPLDSRTGNVLP